MKKRDNDEFTDRSLMNADLAAFANSPIFDQVPTEDVGSQTYSRFRYQAEVAARHCLTHLLDKNFVAVLCEWHEDFVILHRARQPELNSVKHRELSQGPWPLKELITKGGLKHLYDRWLALEETPRCFLLTNAGLKPGKDEARDCIDKVHSREVAEIETIVPRLCNLFREDDESRLLRFLKVLSVESELPKRTEIQPSNIENYLRPILSQLGLDAVHVAAIYSDLVRLFENAIRAEGGNAFVLEYLRDPRRLELQVARNFSIASRVVLRTDIEGFIVERVEVHDRQMVAESPLELKLDKGGLGPTSINSAKRFRASWSEFEARFRQDLPVANDKIKELRGQALALAAKAEREARDQNFKRYGAAMLSSLERIVKVENLSAQSLLPLREELVIGLVYQLTDECEVWWSDRFVLPGLRS